MNGHPSINKWTLVSVSTDTGQYLWILVSVSVGTGQCLTLIQSDIGACVTPTSQTLF